MPVLAVNWITQGQHGTLSGCYSDVIHISLDPVHVWPTGGLGESISSSFQSLQRMAHGWDSYFQNLEPLSSDPRALRGSSESEGSLSQHIENFIGHHDFSNMVASQEAPATNSNFNTNFYSNPSISSSDCVYQRYYGEMPWQADGEQIVRDCLPRCGNSDIPDFATDGLSTSGHFPSSFAADLQELKQDCGILTSSFLEDYSDVSSCSETDVNETRPSCKFMTSNSDPKPKTDVTKKHSPSEWPLTPTGNMSLTMESLCPNASETALALPSLSKGEAGENMADCAQDKMESVEKLVKTIIKKDEFSGTSKMVRTTASESTEDSHEHDGCQEQQEQQRVDVEEERALIQDKESDTPISGHGNSTEDVIKVDPDGNGEEQICQDKCQETTVVAPNNMAAFDSAGEDDLNGKENKEAFDEQKNPSLISMDDQDKNMRKDDQDKEMQSSTFESSDSQGIKVSHSQDATLREYTSTLAAASSAVSENDSHSLETQDIICSGPVEGSDCDSIDLSENNEQSLSNHLVSCLKPNSSSTDMDPCLEKEWTSPAEKKNISSFPDQEQSSQQSQMAIEPPVLGDISDNIRESFQELHTTFKEEPSVLGMLYGEPLSREDSPSEADETQSETNQSGEALVARHENESRNHLEIQAPQLKCSVQVRKRLQPIVILKTLEPTNATNKTYVCADCQHTTQNVDHLIEHHHYSHSLHKFQFCQSCNIYLMSNEQAQKHLCGVTDEALQLSFDSTLPKKRKRHTLHKCNKCRLTFHKFYHYVKHMRTHTGKTPFKCNGCGLYFAQSSTLHRHKRVPGRCRGQKHTVSAANSDVIIKKAKTTTQKGLAHNSHYASLPECYVKLVDVCKTNVCHFCSKSFSTTDKLKKHSYNVHKGGKSGTVALNQCTKNVSASKTLKGGNEARGKHKCPLCPRVFKYSYNRARHLRDCIRDLTYGCKGKIGNKYQCPLCHASFTLPANRRRHIKNTCLKEYHSRLARNKTESKENEQKKQTPPTLTSPQNVRRYKCSLCPAIFCHASGKYRHMKKHELFKITGKLFKYRNSSFLPISKQTKFSSKKTEECKDTLTSNETSSSLALACRFCGKCFSTSLSLKKHERGHKGERPYRCLECGKGFKKHAYLISHKMVHQRRIQCTVCRKILPTIGELIQHRKSHLKKGMLQCPDCPMQFQYPVYLLRHMDSHKREEKKALPVEERPTLKSQLQSLKEQTEQKKLQCSLCKEVFHDAQALRRHSLEHISGSSSRQCPFCKRHFSCRRYLLRHMQRHTGDKPFPCGICGKQFYRKMYLELHHEKCSVAEPRHAVVSQTDTKCKKSFQCSYCPRVFARSNRLKKHHHGHKSKSLIVCSKCGQFFGYTKLTQHERDCSGTSELNIGLSSPNGHCGRSAQKNNPKVHGMSSKSNATGTKMLQHKCPHCPQKFKYRSILLRHIVSHTGEQPYACMHCGHKYGSQSMCLQHEAFCDGVYREGQSKGKSDVATKLSDASSLREVAEKLQAEGEYKCKFCTKTFMKSRNLRRHILTHTEVKPYRCKACDSCFSRYDYLKVHQSRCRGKRQRLEVCIPKISLDDVGKGWQNKFDRLTIEKQQTFECNLCSRSFSAQSKLSRHFSMFHATKSFSCTRCGASFTLEKSLKRHKRLSKCRRASSQTNGSLPVRTNPQAENVTRQLHGMTSRILQRIQPYFNKKHKYVCNYCPRSFGTSSQLRVHTRLHTGEKPFGCEHCGERFIRRDYLQRHSVKCNQTEQQMNSVLCDRCGGFFSKDKLQNHKKRCSSTPSLPDHSQQSTPQSPPKGFSCAYCNSRFLMFSQLQEHFLNAHKQDTVLKPPVSTAPLQQHLSNIVSIKEEPLDEREVDKQLSGDGNLLFDQDANFDDKMDKPFACPDCNMSFLNKSGLSGHVRVHSKRYPFTCKRCKKGFWNKHLQRNHSRKCRGLGIVAKRNSNLESGVPMTAEMDLALNDSVLVFKQGSQTTGTGVLQTNFSCKDDLKDIPPQNSGGNQEQSSSSRERKAVQYQCSECDKSFTDGLMLISHLEDHGRLEQEKKRNTCSKCGRVCTSQGNLEKHMRMHGIYKTHSCPDCIKTFPSLTELEIHRTCHDPNRPFVCKVCKQRFWTRPSLCNHYSETHPNDVYTCNFCNKSYSIRKSLVRHYRMRHQNKQMDGHIDGTVKEKRNTEQPSNIQPNVTGESDEDSKDENNGSEDSDSDSAPYFPCHVCGKTFLTSESLEDHQRCHLGEKPHECAECGKCFFQASQLQQHERMHKSEFQCQTCGRGFVSLFALRKHKHTHGKSRPYRCSKCHLSFTGPSQLAEHMATHREDNFPCDICNRTFSSKSSRAEHRKSHSKSGGCLPPLISPEEQNMSQSLSEFPLTMTKELKYRCGICSERFKDPEELSEHGCMAAKERPYSCPDCNKHFLHGSHLRKHRASHQLSQPSVYHCNQCNNSFSSSQHFLSHLKNHGDNDTAVDTKGDAVEKDGVPSHVFKCPICHRHSANATELINHFSVHSDVYECKICKLTFLSKIKLEEHEHCHLTAATQFECTECCQSFLGRDAFCQHHCSHRQHAMEIEYSSPSTKKSPVTYNQAMGEEEEVDVTGEDFYNCPVCSKRFSSKSGLLEHQNKQHPNERPFKCELCGKTFNLRRYLRDHERRHRQKMDIQNKAQSNEEQFKCSQCPIILETAQGLSLHMRMHAEQEVGEHRCDMCYKSFSQLSLLRQHQESHVGQVVYECTECDKAFAFPHLLEEHQQTHAGPSV